jgi:hypothetical protein
LERGFVGCALGVVNMQEVATNTLLLLMNVLNYRENCMENAFCWERMAEAVIHTSKHSSLGTWSKQFSSL